jgi:hypothetical protein
VPARTNRDQINGLVAGHAQDHVTDAATFGINNQATRLGVQKALERLIPQVFQGASQQQFALTVHFTVDCVLIEARQYARHPRPWHTDVRHDVQQQQFRLEATCQKCGVLEGALTGWAAVNWNQHRTVHGFTVSEMRRYPPEHLERVGSLPDRCYNGVTVSKIASHTVLSGLYNTVWNGGILTDASTFLV